MITLQGAKDKIKSLIEPYFFRILEELIVFSSTVQIFDEIEQI